MTCRGVRKETQVGTCGFGRAQADYARSFSCVEVQHTFYQPPQLKTLERWRMLMPSDFEFVIKAWQLITHDARSPTYRRLKRQLSGTEKMEAGYFRNSAIVKEAWDTTLAWAKALSARTILFQCPASFTQTTEHITNLERFFTGIDRQGLGEIPVRGRCDGQIFFINQHCVHVTVEDKRHAKNPVIFSAVVRWRVSEMNRLRERRLYLNAV